ncbi:MAG: HepT-like ribonuclease domain-containing protein [Bacillota bacterium]
MKIKYVLIHDYMGVNIKTVWNVIENELPKLKEDIKKLTE